MTATLQNKSGCRTQGRDAARERAARFGADELRLIMPQFQKDGIEAAAKAFDMPVEKFVAVAALFFATSRSVDKRAFEVTVLQAMDPDSWDEQSFVETAEHELS